MKRRDFIKKSVLGTTAISMPFVLKSGSLFASTGNQIADHVVFVAFAGGVRQQEAVLQRYLGDSQDYPSEGNILANLLNGAAPTDKVVYGTDGASEGDTPIPKILNNTLETQGTLFKEMRSSHPGHYGGLNTLLSGNYMYTQGLRSKPEMPTIFEYVRKHMGVPASKVWYIGNGIGNSIPLLDYSIHPDYGSQYGANFLAPTITFGNLGFEHLQNAKIYHPEEELSPMYKMKYFLDNVWYSQGKSLPNIGNTEEEKYEIKEFFKEMFQKTEQGVIAHPPVNGGELNSIGYACEVMKRFKPTLSVVYLSSVDVCHSNFTSYLQNLHRADHGVAHLWDYIQNQIPEMAGKTTLILAPEQGRNLEPNNIKDKNGFWAFDHDDENTKRVFGMMAGPGVQSNLSVGSEGNPKGDIVNIVPTISELLGIKNEVIGSGNLASSQSLFDFI